MLAGVNSIQLVRVVGGPLMFCLICWADLIDKSISI